MQLGLTLPLQRFLDCKLPPCQESPDPAFCWDLHLLKLNSRNGLILVNASNRFAIYLHGLKKRDWDRLPELAAEQIYASLAEEELPPSWVNRYRLAAGPVELCGTHGRSPVAGLNRAVECLRVGLSYLDTSRMDQLWLNDYMNTDLCHAAGFSDYGTPKAFLRADFARLFGELSGI